MTKRKCKNPKCPYDGFCGGGCTKFQIIADFIQRERVPTEKDIKDANDCPSCDAFGICPSHKWIHKKT